MVLRALSILDSPSKEGNPFIRGEKMSQLIASIFFVISMWLGSPAPTTVALVPDNGDNAVNIASIGFFDSLSNHEVEDGANVGIFEVMCAQNGTSLTGSYNVTTSGGNYPTTIDVSKCSDLTSSGGATYQSVGTTFELEFSCNSDCDVYQLTSQFEQEGFNQFEVGKIWVSVTGPSPELIIIDK